MTISGISRPRMSPNIGQLQALNLSSLERLNAIQLSDAVKFFAGTTVKDYGGIGGLKTVSVRSLGASHTGIFIDKIPINNAMNGQIDLSRFTLDNVSEIRLSNDNFSNTLQTASYYSKSSQLSIISNRPTFDESLDGVYPERSRRTRESNTQVDVSLKVGSFGLFNPQFNINRKLKKQFISLNADYQKAKGNYPFKLVNGNITTTETRNNSAVESGRIDLTWQSFSNSRHNYFVKANYYHNHRQLPGHVVLYNTSSNQEMWDKEKSLQGQYHYIFFDSTEILFNAKVSETFNQYIDHDFNASRPLNNQFTQQEYFGSGAVQSRKYKGFQASLSSDAIYHNMRSNLRGFVYPTRLTSLTNLALNYTLQSVLFYGNILQTATFEQAESTNVAKNHYRFSPTFGLNVQFKKCSDFSTRFFYKETYRIPTFNELYYTNNVGDRRLSPELAKQLNVGISVGESVNERLYFSISIDGYYNTVRDKIIAIPLNNLFTWSMRNFGKVDILGLDATLRGGFEVNKTLDFYREISYSFQDAKDMSNPNSANYKHQIPYTPKHSGSAVFGVNTLISLQYGLMVSGERYRLSVNSPNNRLTPYFDHSILFSKNFSIKKTDLKLAFEILNLTNKNYHIVANYPMPGRQYRLTLKLKIS
ncbi:MAG: TonB-dependent receptor plug domain-containing protein [Bacteroidales bacterium]|nr:TonB-dependent receptor plug domain-containing protein [Bacteroidales bacterium]